MTKIDEIDIQIANLLVEDGRMSSAQIARRIGGLSERAARYRIERMIRDGVIEVRAVANPRAVGYTTLADVRLQVDAESVRDVAARMVEYACVTYVAYAIGETDVSLQVVGRDTAEVYRFISEVAGQMAGVRKTTTSIVPRVLKDVYQWRFPDDACINDEQN